MECVLTPALPLRPQLHRPRRTPTTLTVKGLNELVEAKDREGEDEDGDGGDADDEEGGGEEEEDEDEEADEVELLGEFLLEGEVRTRLRAWLCGAKGSVYIGAADDQRSAKCCTVSCYSGCLRIAIKTSRASG